MDLTKAQLLQIDNYVYVSGIKYYDVRTEIVDHFANILEEKLDKTPDLDFKKEIQNIHRNFSDRGFSKLLKEKTSAVQKQFYKMFFKHLITFFKLPKIIISGALFYVLYLLMNRFQDKENFFAIISYLCFAVVMLLFFSLFINRKKKEIFLKTNMNNTFFLFVNFGSTYFVNTATFRTHESFLNPVHNIIHLTVFVLLILSFWSCYHVYKLNKKEVQKQYPKVIV
ncbi:hypothetical protein [Polaribacter cellanae]|uniref:Uncharacterized protein n=1 Tax=Polaribacter cellanae TaxID=2818493 RepID=A0A975CN28_9FLAO|nr:hypothetical protein [Polaribacter cellanae]QTE21560.1 hypothetical protein J3359_12095 [Polaribacter cellanae]